LYTTWPSPHVFANSAKQSKEVQLSVFGAVATDVFDVVGGVICVPVSTSFFAGISIPLIDGAFTSGFSTFSSCVEINVFSSESFPWFCSASCF